MVSNATPVCSDSWLRVSPFAIRRTATGCWLWVWCPLGMVSSILPLTMPGARLKFDRTASLLRAGGTFVPYFQFTSSLCHAITVSGLNGVLLFALHHSSKSVLNFRCNSKCLSLLALSKSSLFVSYLHDPCAAAHNSMDSTNIELTTCKTVTLSLYRRCRCWRRKVTGSAGMRYIMPPPLLSFQL